MKKIYYFLCALALLCTACEKDTYDITTITRTVVDAHTSTADFIIYVSDQNGNRTAAGVDEIGVFLSTSANPTKQDDKVSLPINAEYRNAIYNEYGAFVISIEGLAANTKYYALPFISNRYSMITGEVVSFTTKGSAKVTTNAASDITSSTARLNGSITTDGGNVTISKRGFVLSTSTNPVIGGSGVDNWEQTGKTGDYYVIYNSLKSSTKYYFRAYAIVNDETVYGSTRSFTTAIPDDAITLSLNDVTDITANSAKVSGTITIGKDAVGQMTECGFLATTDINPTFNSSWYHTWYYNSSTDSYFNTWSGQKNLSGTFSSLSQNTLYYYRMYYKIGTQYYYGTTVKSFRTTASSQSYYTVAQIMNIYNSLGLASGATSTDTYTVRGYVTQWNSGYPDYQNADFFIDDSANGSTSNMRCYRLTGVNASDQRTLVVGDYVEVQNCTLMNYYDQAELKNGTFTVITAASGGSTLGSQVSDFVGTYSARAFSVDDQKYYTWDNVTVSTFNNTNTNTEWIQVAGLNGGLNYSWALGEFDANYKAVRLYSSWAFSDQTFKLTGTGDTLFLAQFFATYVDKNDTEFSSWHVIEDGNGYEGVGEAFMTFNAAGELVVGPAATADSEGYKANGYNFACIYADTRETLGWYADWVEVTLTKTSSTVNAPAKIRSAQPQQWHAPMKLPAKMKNNQQVLRRR